jgi:hypothetical protein
MKNVKKYWFLWVVGLILLVAYADWPYSYYQLVHWVAFIFGAYCAYISYQSGRNAWAVVFAIIAIVFNPLAPFYLQRETWQVLYLATAVPFLVYPFIKNKTP